MMTRSMRAGLSFYRVKGVRPKSKRFLKMTKEGKYKKLIERD